MDLAANGIDRSMRRHNRQLSSLVCRRLRLRCGRLEALLEFAAQFASHLRGAVPAPIDVRRWLVGRNGCRPAIVVDGNHGEITGIRVAALAAADVFGLDADANFHRRAPGKIDRGAEGNEFADMDRLTEHHLIDGYRDRILLGIARGAGKSDAVEQVEQRAAMHFAAEIRHLWRHQHDHLDLSLAGVLHG